MALESELLESGRQSGLAGDDVAVQHIVGVLLQGDAPLGGVRCHNLTRSGTLERCTDWELLRLSTHISSNRESRKGLPPGPAITLGAWDISGSRCDVREKHFSLEHAWNFT